MYRILNVKMKTLSQQVLLKEQKLNEWYRRRDELVTKKDVCFQYISEASLSRIWSKAKDGDFAILTAYRSANSKDRNVSLNRDLRHALNSQKLGPIPVVGHWQECQVTDKDGDPLPWNQCPKDKLVDAIERSYFVGRTNSVSPDVFKNVIFGLGKKYKQDAIVVKIDSLELNGVYDPRTETRFVKFSKGIGMNQVAQAYSQYVKKMNVPFMFEGVETPTATSEGLKAIRGDGFWW